MRVLAWTIAEVCCAAGFVRLLSGAGDLGAMCSAAIWIYLPIVLLRARNLPRQKYGFDLAMWRRGVCEGLGSVVVIVLPFAAVMVALRGMPQWRAAMGIAVLEQLALTAIPEELFFRGYVQARLSMWRPAVAIVMTAVLFAAAHLLVAPGWTRAAVFFPGLVMGWLRHRTGGLLAPAILHGAANVAWVAVMSG
jgi:membrane protease YdiL (CAAX protease family)